MKRILPQVGRIRSNRSAELSSLMTLAALSLSNACTKKSSDTSAAPAPAVAPQLTATPVGQNTSPQGGGGTEMLFRYSLASIAGDAVFCQDFSSRSQAPLNDIETIAEIMATTQAQIPAGVVNPFNLKTLGLTTQSTPCNRIPEVINDGHCAVSLSRDVSSGPLGLQTEQRLLWKDLPILAQASYIKATIDSKNSAIAGKNELFKSVQKQITQQQQFLSVLHMGQQLTTGQQSQFIQQAQEVLTNLQNQAIQLETDVKNLESEIIPVQEELNKTLEKLQTARANLKQSCTPAGMGSMTAEWKAN